MRLLAFVALALVLGCDPGYEFRPDGVKLDDKGRWKASVAGVQLTGRNLMGLIGETWLSDEFRATNDSSEEFTIDDAVLIVDGKQMPMKRVGVDPRWWMVPPKTKDKPVMVSWDFGNATAPKVLGQECTIVIHAHRGTLHDRLVTRYLRTE